MQSTGNEFALAQGILSAVPRLAETSVSIAHNQSLSLAVDNILTAFQSSAIELEAALATIRELKVLEKKYNDGCEFRNAIEQLIRLKSQEKNYNTDYIINNLSEIINHQIDFYTDENVTLFPFVSFLQDSFILQQVLNQEAFRIAQKAIDDFNKKAVLTPTQRLFRHARAWMTGTGVASVLFNFTPLAIFGTLGFFSITVPPAAVFLVPLMFGMLSIAMGGYLIRNMLKIFHSEDKDLRSNINNATDRIMALAHKQTELKKANYIANYTYLSLQNLVAKIKPTNHFHFLVDTQASPPISEKTPIRKLEQNSVGIKTLISFFGTLGTTWGIPSMILGIVGVPLLVGSSFATGGAALALFAFVSSAIFTVQTYLFEKTSLQCKNDLENLKATTVMDIKKLISHEKQIQRELKVKISYLESQLFESVPGIKKEALEEVKAQVKMVEANCTPAVIPSMPTELANNPPSTVADEPILPSVTKSGAGFFKDPVAYTGPSIVPGPGQVSTMSANPNNN